MHQNLKAIYLYPLDADIIPAYALSSLQKLFILPSTPQKGQIFSDWPGRNPALPSKFCVIDLSRPSLIATECHFGCPLKVYFPPVGCGIFKGRVHYSYEMQIYNVVCL